MSHSGVPTRRDSGHSGHSGVAVLVATAFAHRDAASGGPPDSSGTEAVAIHVEASIAAMPDVTRAGVRVAGVLVWCVLSAIGRAPLGAQPPARRAAAVGRLAGWRVPLLAEYVRLTRGLAAAAGYEHADRAAAR